MSFERSPRSGPLKAVTISDEPEHIDPIPPSSDTEPESPTLLGSSPKLYRANISGKKLSGRPPINASTSSASLSHQISSLNLDKLGPEVSREGKGQDDPQALLAQVVEWLHQEKSKRAGHRSHQHAKDAAVAVTDTDASEIRPANQHHGKMSADLALEQLERILAKLPTSSSKYGTQRLGPKTSTSVSRRGSLIQKMRRTSKAGPTSSDTEALDGDFLVPNVEATLDNSKALAFAGGGSSDVDPKDATKRKDQEHWATFKQDIVRLTHTLRLKGWRRIPIKNGAEIEVKRLSGALTNAVYVVSPPKKLPEPEPEPGAEGDAVAPLSRRKPIELLLRVYGPQVEHLIDRDAELQILRRLARKRIGPRMLGTFSNGRFEEFFHARTLTPGDLRDSGTSKQIAKRMRELHDGIELLQAELDEGPRVFLNWNQWVSRCEKIVTWLDKQVQTAQANDDSVKQSKYTKRGLVCGVEWSVFRKTVERYQKHLQDVYGGKDGLKKHLVFAHNDTQYGNLMRLTPDEHSPMLKGENEHKQLVVIDFEYANANTPGHEFANHFTEWCYNYHDQDTAFVCNTNAYPTREEQYRFVKSYVMHRPQFNAAASSTPMMEGREKTNIPDFMLDARNPYGGMTIDYDAEERARLDKMEKDIQRLLNDTRLWRAANTAQWVAWGIVQAKIPEMEEKTPSKAGILVNKIKGKLYPQSDPLDAEEHALQDDAKHDRPEGREQEEAHEEGDAGEEQEFDYLAYAQERAMFFWGDCLQMGFVKPEELPESMKGKVKVVKY